MTGKAKQRKAKGNLESRFSQFSHLQLSLGGAMFVSWAVMVRTWELLQANPAFSLLGLSIVLPYHRTIQITGCHNDRHVHLQNPIEIPNCHHDHQNVDLQNLIMIPNQIPNCHHIRNVDLENLITIPGCHDDRNVELQNLRIEFLSRIQDQPS